MVFYNKIYVIEYFNNTDILYFYSDASYEKQ